MKKKRIVVALLSVMALVGGYLILRAQNGSDLPEQASINPNFLKFMDDFRSGRWKNTTDDGIPLGYIPAPVRQGPVGAGLVPTISALALPVTYDLRTSGRVTPVRNQASCGSCWTFAALASLESFLMPGEPRNFAEQHINKYHGFDWAECGGGNANIATAVLARWSDPYNETEYPYPYTLPTVPVKHVQQAVFLPLRAGSLDNGAIKNAIMTYGAVNFAFYWEGLSNVDGAYWSQTNKCYYYNGSSYSNHEIAFIGWNDDFDKTKFRTPPAGNGAFLCKNSWGTTFGDNGYFWISYYDTSIDDIVSFNNAEPITNYRGKYEYDPLGWVDTWGAGSVVRWGANIFTATSTEKIGAVGFYLTDINATADIYVYNNVTAGAPSSGTLASSKTVTKPYPGYYTVPLTTPVAVTQGQSFSVVIKFTNTTYTFPLATEEYMAGYSTAAANAAGQSFRGSDGITWSDWYAYSSNLYKINNCIKAFVGGNCTPNAKEDLVGTWASGVFYRSSDSGLWTQMGSQASLLAVGDLDGDCIDDLIGIWTGQGGVWVRYSKTGTWAKLSTTAAAITTGDMNGDGKPEFVGTWDGQGVYWRDNTTGAWTLLATPANLITAGDIDGDGKDDIIGIWPSQGGVYTKSSMNGTWTKLSTTAADIAAGDMNGDGRKELLATYDGQGVFYRDSLTGVWSLIATPATQVTCGDLDGDAIDDLIGIWPSQSGVWVKYSKTGSWALLSSSATDIVAGRMRAFGAAGAMDPLGLKGPFGAFISDPMEGPGIQDFSDQAPGGRGFIKKEETNLIPQSSMASTLPKVAGPGEPGFRALEQKNLRPGENIK